jgi:hypothetical protein
MFLASMIDHPLQAVSPKLLLRRSTCFVSHHENFE